MDANTLNRREKRHYRQIIDGNIVYTNSPVNQDVKVISKKEDKSKTQNIISSTVPMDKKELVNKVLDNMSEIINPNLDAIADTIYDQLKNSNMEVTKEAIKDTVSKHYRATGEDQRENSKVNNFENPIDRDKLQLVVDDLYIQIDNENKNEKINADSKKEVVNKIKADFKKKSIPEKEEPSRPIEKNKSQKEKIEPKKDTDIKNLLSDDELDLSEDNEEDDIGLKF